VHVADPTGFIPVDHEIDRDARSKVSTIYLPESTFPMMQPSIFRKFSLEPKRDNCTLSFAFKINPKNGDIEEYEIFPALISQVKKLTYEQVAASLSPEKNGQARARNCLDGKDIEALSHLYELAMLRKCWRASQGAISISLQKPEIKVMNTLQRKGVWVSLEESNCPARELVAEMMIAANQVAGLYAARHGLTVPFRYQEAPDVIAPEELDGLPEHIQKIEMVRRMHMARLSLVPTRHNGLGLDTYVQVTSPIRRFADMASHRQIRAHLSNAKPPYTFDMLAQDYLPQIQERLKHIKRLVQQTTSFWVMQHFMRTTRKKQWEALVVEVEEEATPRYPDYRVGAYFQELGWSRTILLSRRPNRGETLKLQVAHVLPHVNKLVFREATY